MTTQPDREPADASSPAASGPEDTRSRTHPARSEPGQASKTAAASKDPTVTGLRSAFPMRINGRNGQS
ncbi:MAG: hypothetical protein AAGB51_13420 [Planctomycetota bacterium]